MTQRMKDLPLVPNFGKPNAIEPGRKSRKTCTMAKQQSCLKGDGIAKHDVFDQRGGIYKKRHMKKSNEKLAKEKKPKGICAFTPSIFSGTDGAYCIHH